MTGLGTFLNAIAGTLAKRVLSALGIGVVSYAAMSAALNSLLSAAKGAWAGLAGFPDESCAYTNGWNYVCCIYYCWCSCCASCFAEL